jgi:hypothetical protein
VTPFARLWAVALISTCALLAQDSVTGRVAFGGRPVPGAVVTARQGSASWTAISAENGRFQFDALPPGALKLEVRLFGFRTVNQDVTLEGRAKPAEIALALEPYRPRLAGSGGAGARGQNGSSQNGENNAETQVAKALEGVATVAPTAEASDSAEAFLVQGSTSRGLQEGDRVANLDFGPEGPGGRGPGGQGGEGNQAAAALTGGGGGGRGGMGGPGGGMGGPGGGMGGPGGGGMDGGPGGFGGRGGPGGGRGGDFANMTPEQRAQAIARMRGRSPEGFGNRSRRARDQIRGGAQFTARNGVLDASPFSLNGNSVTKPDYAQYRFGASIGGPLVLGKIFNSNNSFFFINYNANRGDTVNNRYGLVPTAAQRSGDLSSVSSAIYDPLTNAPFAGNLIPTTRISSIASGLLNYFPNSNQASAKQNYRLTSADKTDSDNLSVRLNRSFRKTDRLAWDLAWQRRNSTNAQLFGWTDAGEGTGINSNLSWSHNFSARTIHSARVRFNKNYNLTTPHFAFGTDVAGALGIRGTSRDAANYGPPNLSFTNFADLSDGNRSRRNTLSMGLGEGWTLVRGKHSLSTGFDYTRMRQNALSDPNARGLLYFAGSATAQVSSSGSTVSGTGYDLADFLLGSVQQSSIRFGSPDTYLRQNQFGVYGQDEWRLRTNLTLNLGLRWDDWEPNTEKYGRMSNLDVAPGYADVMLVTPGTNGSWSGKTPNGMIRPDRNNLSPRIGIAYKPFKNGHTIVRGGFSIFYDNSVYSRVASRLVYQEPFATSATYTTSAANPLTLATPFVGSSSTTISNNYAFTPDYPLARAKTWSLSVQQSAKGYIFEGGYLGTQGSGLAILRSPNRIVSGSTRKISYASAFTYETPEGSSIFNAVTVRVNRRMRRGVNWSAFYQFSKSIDNASSIGGSGSSVVQNESDLAAERGLSSFDRRHQFSFNTQVMSPWGPNAIWMRQRSALTTFLRDWTVSGTFTASSGNPLTARAMGSSTDRTGTGTTSTTRADATGESVSGGSGYFNTAAFTTPVGTYGTAGRGTIPGPGSYNLNANFGRSFQLGDSSRRRLEARLEATNILNHANITGYGTVVDSTTYGLATSAGSMRSIQLTLRVRF